MTTATSNFGINEYIERAKQGDESAFQEIVSYVGGTVSAIALAVTHDLQDSKDVSQLVFIKLWQQLNSLKITIAFYLGFGKLHVIPL